MEEKLSKLSEAIYTCKDDPKKENLPLQVLATMYANNDYLYIPTNEDEQGRICVNWCTFPEFIDKGEFFPINSDMKFFRNRLGTGVMIFGVKKVFEIVMTKKENCGGIVLNPLTDCECFMSKEGVKSIIDFYNINKD